MCSIPTNYPLYDFTYGRDFPCEQFFIHCFNQIPSRYSTRKKYDGIIVDYLAESGFIIESEIYYDNDRTSIVKKTWLINHKKNLMAEVVSTNDDYIIIEFFYNIKHGKLNQQIDFTKLEKFRTVSRKSNIQLVKSDHGNLNVEDFDLHVPEFDLELNYGGEFVKKHNIITQRLNNQYDKGIILLHGIPGSGKTTYLKYLTTLIEEKNILFISPSMAEIISEPSIIPFLMDNRNSILLIEDAERVIGDRQGKGSQAGVSNILNLTDGILGDCLNIQVIATFNMSREKIDPALLRKGRLIAEHKFDKLNLEETNRLLKSLNKVKTSNVPLTLADIYNIDEDDVRITKDESKLGFG